MNSSQLECNLDDPLFSDYSEKQTDIFSSEDEFFSFVKNAHLVYDECDFADENGMGCVEVYQNGNDFVRISSETYFHNSKVKYHWKYAVKVYPKTITTTIYEEI